MEKAPALIKPCNYKGDEELTNNRLSELPHDVLLSILSSFTVKEVARTRLVSKNWKTWLVRYYPKLNFDNYPMVLKKLSEMGTAKFEFLPKERSDFVRYVNVTLKEYLGESIDELSIKFDLDKSFQSDIDNWLAYAFAKGVKRLQLDFIYVGNYEKGSQRNRYHLKLESYKKTLSINQSLSCLCMRSVNITSQDVETLLNWCPFLDNLYIDASEYLTEVRSSSPSLRLKYVTVAYCPRLLTIDISAPNMVFFRYYGVAIELNIRNASSLSEISFGASTGVDIVYAFKPLISRYYSQLKALSLHFIIGLGCNNNMGVEISHLQPFAKLKVLRLCFTSSYQSTILGWVPLIEACVVLEKLTLKFYCFDYGPHFPMVRRNGTPLKCLKTLEVVGYRGHRIDFEIAVFVLENAIMLEEVIVDVGLPSNSNNYPVDPYECVRHLRTIIPSGVKFILMNSNA